MRRAFYGVDGQTVVAISPTNRHYHHDIKQLLPAPDAVMHCSPPCHPAVRENLECRD